MHTAHALPTPWTCAVLVLCVSSVSTSEQVSTGLSPLFRNKPVCVEAIEMDDDIPSGKITVMDQRSYIKIETTWYYADANL
jgi:hypothetical protein